MSEPTQKQDLTALGVCQRIEEVAGRIYQLLAQAHHDHPETAALWTKTAGEEEQHARHFRLLQERFISKVNVDLAPATATLRFLEFMLRDYRRQAPSVHQGLLDAIALEEKLEEFHAVHAVDFGDESVKRLFELLMVADKGHKEALREALDRLTG